MKKLATAFALVVTAALPVAAQTVPLALDMAGRAMSEGGQIVVFGTDRSVPTDRVIAQFNGDADGQDGRIHGLGTPISGVPTHGAEIFDRLRAENDGR